MASFDDALTLKKSLGTSFLLCAKDISTTYFLEDTV